MTEFIDSMKVGIDCVKCVPNREVEEMLYHLIVECLACDPARDMAIIKYKGILGEGKFTEVINLDDNGLGFLLGIGNKTSDWVVKIWGITKPRTSASCGYLQTVVQTLQIRGLET